MESIWEFNHAKVKGFNSKAFETIVNSSECQSLNKPIKFDTIRDNGEDDDDEQDQDKSVTQCTTTKSQDRKYVSRKKIMANCEVSTKTLINIEPKSRFDQTMTESNLNNSSFSPRRRLD
jgi:hypothetical protein